MSADGEDVQPGLVGELSYPDDPADPLFGGGWWVGVRIGSEVGEADQTDLHEPT
ncbi:hypothetical protein ACH4T9_24085 [Micromonospora sp. NPDC020750]|uniref:hypothetical protein n=1 Tax=unclassified Micromonospora TaxID=2617518 RepID=UPI0037B76B83